MNTCTATSRICRWSYPGRPRRVAGVVARDDSSDSDTRTSLSAIADASDPCHTYFLNDRSEIDHPARRCCQERRMDEASLVVERRSDRVIARLNRPAKRNAIDREMIDALHALCDELETDPRTL